MGPRRIYEAKEAIGPGGHGLGRGFIAHFMPPGSVPNPETMVRIYARENATQRGHQVTAIDGSVLASVRLLVKQLLSDAVTSPGTRRGSIFESERAFDTAKGQLLTDRGIGQNLVERILKNMPGMTRNSIGASLERLKASGDYARNIQAIAGTMDPEDSARVHRGATTNSVCAYRIVAFSPRAQGCHWKTDL